MSAFFTDWLVSMVSFKYFDECSFVEFDGPARIQSSKLDVFLRADLLAIDYADMHCSNFLLRISAIRYNSCQKN